MSANVFRFLNISFVLSNDFCDILLLFESLYHKVPGFLLILIVPHSYSRSLYLYYLSPSAAVDVDLTQ